MPTFPVKPLIKLTKEQWKEVLKRVFEKEVKLTPKVAGELMKFEPPVTREMGTLARDVAAGGLGKGSIMGRPVGESTRTFERLPIEEARAKYFANPSEYVTPTSEVEPSVREIASFGLPPESPLGASEMAKRVAYERLQFSPIIPPGEAIGGEPSVKSAVSPKVRPESSLPSGTEIPPVGEAVQIAQIADTLWKDLGGARSTAGKWWQELLSSSRGAVKSHFTTGRDYFISSYYNWKKDPVKFGKNYPRETRLLEQIQAQFEKSVEPGVK